MREELWFGDLHMHTNLSYCAPRDTTAMSFLPCLEKEQVKICGFSNHLYYPDWLPEQDREDCEYPGVARAEKIKPELLEFAQKSGAKVLFGCEIETVYGREPSLPLEKGKAFDYVLLAPSHIANIGHAYRNVDLSTANKYRDMILDRFLYACSLDYGVPAGICHPIYPICSPFEQEVVDGIPDQVMKDCFEIAKNNKKSIEIHVCLFRNGTKLDENGVSQSYLRVLRIAKEAGCKFHFGGDAHGPGAFMGVHERLRKAAESVGITPKDMWDIV